MKGNWLYLAMALVTIGLTDQLYWRLVLAAGWLFLLKSTVSRRRLVKIGLFIAAFLVCSISFPHKITCGRVTAVKKGYVIVRNGFTGVMLYSKDNTSADLDDTVAVDCQLNEISGYDNFEVSTFQSWARGQNIFYSGNIDRFQILQKGNTLRSYIYRHNERYGNSWMNQLLFGRGIDSDSDLRQFFVLSGMHYSFLFAAFRKILGWFYYPETVLRKQINLAVILGVIFHFPYGLVRILANLISQLFIDEERDRCGFVMTVMAFWQPYYIRSLSFLLPLGIRFISLFCEKNSPLISRLFVILLQLRFNGYCDLTSMAVFTAMRNLSGMYYCLALALWLFPIRIPLPETVMNWFLDLPALFRISLNGRLSLAMFAAGVYLLLKYGVIFRRRYLIALAAVLMINSHQAALHPYYSVSFLDVGQGDCAVVSFPFSSHGLLIDTGGSNYKDVGNDIVIPYLHAQGFSSVDVIISHQDYDHCGALEALMTDFRVNEIYLDKQDIIEIQGLRIFDPLYDQEYPSLNDNSQVSYFRIGETGFLFLGDVSQYVEEDLVRRYGELDVDVVKIAHHGSATGTSDLMLETYRPYLAVISCGRSNTYKHPSSEVTGKLDNWLIKYLTTSENNAVRVTVTKWLTVIRTADGKVAVRWSDDLLRLLKVNLP